MVTAGAKSNCEVIDLYFKTTV